MLRPTSLKEIPHYPVTASVSVAAIAVTIMWWTGQNVDAFFMDGQVWAKWELWRALSSTLPHVNFFHLAFNLYWFWIFGTLMERVFGHFRFAGLIVLLALGSMLAEFALSSGGVGLSGVGYGLWGMLWVLEKRDARFHDAVDEQTSRMFIGWFVLCIVLTVINVMPVANIAHGVGAVMGALLGLAISGKGSVKQTSRAGLAALLVFILAGATIFWPYINLSGHAEPEVERAALDALDQGKITPAVKLLTTATTMRHAPARAWYNLGIAYEKAGKFAEASTAFTHASQMPDSDSEMDQAAQNVKKLLNQSDSFRFPGQAAETNNLPPTDTGTNK
ncbi:MAG TPA: rhomboid family intramembrane serine protease [Verrucomicrobiae bacterium]|nr:rhomboid family intramembrane serine protease [Verrucomicrobiae bacterium]